MTLDGSTQQQPYVRLEGAASVLNAGQPAIRGHPAAGRGVVEEVAVFKPRSALARSAAHTSLPNSMVGNEVRVPEHGRGVRATFHGSTAVGANIVADDAVVKRCGGIAIVVHRGPWYTHGGTTRREDNQDQATLPNATADLVRHGCSEICTG